jgi:hypothetical protein
MVSLMIYKLSQSRGLWPCDIYMGLSPVYIMRKWRLSYDLHLYFQKLLKGDDLSITKSIMMDIYDIYADHDRLCFVCGCLYGMHFENASARTLWTFNLLWISNELKFTNVKWVDNLISNELIFKVKWVDVLISNELIFKIKWVDF